MGLSLALTSAGAYSITVTNDPVGSCPIIGQSNCSDSGTYTDNGSRLHLDDGDVGYTLDSSFDDGGARIVTIAFNATDYTAVFTRQ